MKTWALEGLGLSNSAVARGGAPGWVSSNSSIFRCNSRSFWLMGTSNSRWNSLTGTLGGASAAYRIWRSASWAASGRAAGGEEFRGLEVEGRGSRVEDGDPLVASF